MKVKASRDAGEYSLTRVGTFRIGSTACQIPFKMRKLTSNPHCDAVALMDEDHVHLNELFELPNRKRFTGLIDSKKRTEEIHSLESKLKLVGGSSHQNMVFMPSPKGTKYTKNLADAIVETLCCKNNNLILIPLNESRKTLDTRSVLLRSLKDRMKNEPFRQQVVGYIPARTNRYLVDDLLSEYVKLGVNAFAVDAAGGPIPPGMLGRVNAYLDKTMNGDFLIIALRVPEVSGDGGGQTLMANDLANLPRGYDGFAPQHPRFGPKKKKKNELEGMSPDQITRYKAERMKDKKGKKRLFVPRFWGRTQVAAVLEEEPELVSMANDSPFRTRTSKRNDIAKLFDDDSCTDLDFGQILKCHDTELIEGELVVVGEAARDGMIETKMKEKDYARDFMKVVKAEKKVYDSTMRDKGRQSKI
jgi:hypothetical protein